MIDLQELRKAAKWLNEEWNSLPEDANIIDFEDRKIQIVPSQFIELLDRLEAAEAVCNAVAIRLKQHHQSCDYVTHRMIDEPCSCGAWQLNKALAAWQKVKEGQ